MKIKTAKACVVKYSPFTIYGKKCVMLFYYKHFILEFACLICAAGANGAHKTNVWNKAQALKQYLFLIYSQILCLCAHAPLACFGPMLL